MNRHLATLSRRIETVAPAFRGMAMCPPTMMVGWSMADARGYALMCQIAYEAAVRSVARQERLHAIAQSN